MLTAQVVLAVFDLRLTECPPDSKKDGMWLGPEAGRSAGLRRMNHPSTGLISRALLQLSLTQLAVQQLLSESELVLDISHRQRSGGGSQGVRLRTQEKSKNRSLQDKAAYPIELNAAYPDRFSSQVTLCLWIYNQTGKHSRPTSQPGCTVLLEAEPDV